MKRTKFRLTVCITLLILTLAFIWGNSLLPSAMSTKISKDVQHVVVQTAPSVTPQKVKGTWGYGIIRKWMHGLEFFVLGVELAWLFGMLGLHTLLPLCAGIVCAWIDEALQFFQPGRGPGLQDVGRDCLGVALGLVLVNAAFFVNQKRKSRPNKRGIKLWDL